MDRVIRRTESDWEAGDPAGGYSHGAHTYNSKCGKAVTKGHSGKSQKSWGRNAGTGETGRSEAGKVISAGDSCMSDKEQSGKECLCGWGRYTGWTGDEEQL